MCLRNLRTGQEVMGHGTFSNQRILIGAFFIAEKVLRDLVMQVEPLRWWDKFIRLRRYDVVIDVLELNEGGLSEVEERAIMEVVAGGTAMRYHRLVISCVSQPRSDDAVRALLTQGRA